MKLVAFDLDGTLIDADVAERFAEAAGKGKKAAAIQKKAAEGKLTPEESLVRRAKLLKGWEYEKLEEAVEKLPLMNGARRAVTELKNRGVKLAVVSGSFAIAADMVKRQLGLDYVVGNELVVKDGKLTGEVEGPTLEEGSKGKVLVKLAKRAGVPLKKCAAVGNGVNDKSMLDKAGLKIAFHSSSLDRVADIIIEEKDLTRILPHVLGEGDVEELRRKRDELRERILVLKRDISEQRSAMRDIGNSKRDVINTIKVKNSEANKLKASRDELNERVKAVKAERDKANERVKALMAEFKALQEKAPKGDFKKLMREVRTLEWRLQTRVMEIKKEDALVARINQLNKELDEYKGLIKLSKEIDEQKKNSRKLHEKILSLSQESQHYHEDFLQAVEKIRELEAKIDGFNKEKEEIAPGLDEKREELRKLSEEYRKLEREIKVLEEETDVRSTKRTEKELKERASKVYERFKRGEKLDLEDIYLLRRFNLV